MMKGESEVEKKSQNSEPEAPAESAEPEPVSKEVEEINVRDPHLVQS